MILLSSSDEDETSNSKDTLRNIGVGVPDQQSEEAIPSLTEVVATKAKPVRQAIKLSKWYSPVPLFIEDILKIEFNEKNCSLFGLSFTEIVCYGHAVGEKVQCMSKKNVWKYRVDDGTASIMVLYAHGSQLNNGKQMFITQNTMTFFYTFSDLNKLETQIRHNTILKSFALPPIHQRNSSLTPFQHGKKVLAIGKPSYSSYSKTISVWANRMFVDDGRNRSLELKFKDNLERLYCTVYK